MTEGGRYDSRNKCRREEGMENNDGGRKVWRTMTEEEGMENNDGGRKAWM